MILFHGSNMRVTEIDLSKSRPAKDFGRAFFVLANRETDECEHDYDVVLSSGLSARNVQLNH